MADLEQTAEQLFAEALDLPPEQRSAFLDQACRGAPELRRLVEGLLHENQRMGSFLADPLFTPETAAPPNSAAFDPDSSSPIGFLWFALSLAVVWERSMRRRINFFRMPASRSKSFARK